MKINFIFYLIATLFLFLSCKERPSLDKNLWVGTYRVLDQNIPYPFLIGKNKDTLFLINHKNEIIDKTIEHPSSYLAGDTIKMKNHDFFIIRKGSGMFLFDFRDSLTFPFMHPKNGAIFKKAKETEKYKIASIKAQLLQNTYSAKVESFTPNSDLELVKTWHFSKDSLKTSFTYFYKGTFIYAEQQRKNYHLFERSGKLFFSENEVAENPQMLYQITDFGDKTFSIQYYRNNKRIIEDYTKANKENFQADAPFYSNCLEGQPGEYYHPPQITYNKGNEYLVQKISANAPLDKGNGYITIHFRINCNGKIGRLGLEQMDPDYQPTSFSVPLVEHIITEVTKLKDWPEVKPRHFFKGVHAFLMFKIENGKITDLCP